MGKNLTGLQSLGVRAIVNVAAGDVENLYEGIFTYHNIAVSDKKDEQGHRANVLPYLDSAADFIAESLNSGACFVHCMGGDCLLDQTWRHKLDGCTAVSQKGASKNRTQRGFHG